MEQSAGSRAPGVALPRVAAPCAEAYSPDTGHSLLTHLLWARGTEGNRRPALQVAREERDNARVLLDHSLAEQSVCHSWHTEDRTPTFTRYVPQSSRSL